MRGTRLALLCLFSATAACRAGSTEPEPGAVLLQIKRPAGAPAPDELRVWVYDNGGRLWDGVRIPAEGALPADQPELGTVLIQPGVVNGQLRIHLRGLLAGVRVLDGVAVVDPALGARTVEVLLDSAILPDGDGDGVPDSFDDCVEQANPGQGGCASVAVPDAAVDGPSGPADVADASDSPFGSEVEADGALRDLAPAEDAGPRAHDTPPVLPDLGGWLPDTPADRAPEAVPDTVPPADVRDGGGQPDLRDGGTDRVADSSDAVGDTTDASADRADGAPEAPRADVAADGPGADAAACADVGCLDRSQGEPCAGNGECASGFCADGVCCTNACLGPCRSCNHPSATGVCQSYGAGSDPELECSAGTSCNGAGACGASTSPDLANGELCSAGSQCRSGQCVDGVCCASRCDQPCESCGTGTCLPVRKADDVPECAGNRTCNPTGKCVDE